MDRYAAPELQSRPVVDMVEMVGYATNPNDPILDRVLAPNQTWPIRKLCPVADFQATVTRWTAMGRYVTFVQTIPDYYNR